MRTRRAEKRKVARGGLVCGSVAVAIATAATSPALAGSTSFKLCRGFTIVTAVAYAQTDYESIKFVEAVTPEGVRIRYSNQFMFFDPLATVRQYLVRTLTFRTIRNVDMQSATLYQQQFDTRLPEIVPETTAISISRDLYRQIKETGSAQMGIFVAYSGSGEISIDRAVHPNVYDNQAVVTVTREAESPPMDVVVNNKKVALPTMTFGGDFYGDKSQFVVLDDVTTPLMLKFRIGIDKNANPAPEELAMRKVQGLPPLPPDKEALQVVKIATPCPPPQDVAAAPPKPPKPVPPIEPPDSPLVVADGAPLSSSGSGPMPAEADVPPAPPAPPPDMPPANLDTGYPPTPQLPPPVIVAEAPPEPPPPPPPPPSPPTPPTPPAPPAPSVQSAVLEQEIEADGSVDIQAIFFSVDSSEIRPESEPALTAIAEVLKRHPDWKMSIEGHTDSQADEAYNLNLSKERAASVKAALVTLYDIADGRLTTTGYGESKPVADNKTLGGRAQNRRVVLVKL